MSRGRKPVPLAAKALAGTLQPCRINREAPDPGPISEPDISLTPAERVVWLETVNGAAPGHFRRSDAGLLRTYCASVVRRDQIAAELAAWVAKPDKRDGETALLVKGPRGALTPHPAYRLLSQAERELRSLAAEMGLSPTSRERVHANDQAGLFDDSFYEFVPRVEHRNPEEKEPFQ